MMKIGVYGSAFDPVTYPHLWILNTVMNRKGLDLGIFVPSTSLRIDKGRKLTSNEHRVEMLQRAINEKPKFKDKFIVSDVEIKASPGEYYTYYTMKKLKEQYPEDELFFIIGADNLEQLSSWKYGEELIQENKFIIMSREGIDMLDVIAKDAVLRKYDDGRFHCMKKGIEMEISSTYIRDEIRVGGDPSFLLPSDCIDYIEEHGLYKE